MSAKHATRGVQSVRPLGRQGSVTLVLGSVRIRTELSARESNMSSQRDVHQLGQQDRRTSSPDVRDPSTGFCVICLRGRSNLKLIRDTELWILSHVSFFPAFIGSYRSFYKFTVSGITRSGNWCTLVQLLGCVAADSSSAPVVQAAAAGRKLTWGRRCPDAEHDFTRRVENTLSTTS